MQRKEKEGIRPLGFERSGSEKKTSDYNVGERHAAKYWIDLY
jgi:hypothetical protein